MTVIEDGQVALNRRLFAGRCRRRVSRGRPQHSQPRIDARNRWGGRPMPSISKRHHRSLGPHWALAILQLLKSEGHTFQPTCIRGPLPGTLCAAGRRILWYD